MLCRSLRLCHSLGRFQFSADLGDLFFKRGPVCRSSRACAQPSSSAALHSAVPLSVQKVLVSCLHLASIPAGALLVPKLPVSKLDGLRLFGSVIGSVHILVLSEASIGRSE